MLVYSEEQWFDEFYPKEWGNWRECFNIKKFREHIEATGCCWMNYKTTGYCLSENGEGLMEIRPYKYSKPYTLEHFFVETACCEIQPFKQPKLNKMFAGVAVSKIQSNLTIYSVYIYGCDDASYTKHFSSEDGLNEELKYIKKYGIYHIFYKDSDYFFTN